VNCAALLQAGQALLRFRLSSACAVVATALPDITAGSEIQDLIVTLGTIDLVLGELDR